MTGLQKFQSDFAEAIRADAPNATPGQVVVNHAWRFSVYRNNFFHGLIEQLREAYPVVHQVLGGEGFTAVARGYLVHHPPATRSLALFGDAFPKYLALISLTKDDPLICDMARLERAWLEALHAADARPLNPESLTTLGDRLVEARFGPHPAARLLTSQISVVDHWRVRRSGTNPSTPQNVGTGAQGALVTRPRQSVQVCPLSVPEAIFGRCLFEGVPVSEAVDQAARDDAFDITEAFRKFLAAGAFSTVEI